MTGQTFAHQLENHFFPHNLVHLPLYSVCFLFHLTDCAIKLKPGQLRNIGCHFSIGIILTPEKTTIKHAFQTVKISYSIPINTN